MKKLFVAILVALFLAPLAQAGTPVITSKGIGKVKIGAKVSKLPQQMSGVYDKLELVSEDIVDEGAYEETVSLYRASLNGETVFEFYPIDEKVDYLTIYSKNLKMSNGLGLESLPAELFENGAKVISFNDGGEALLVDGVLFKGLPMTPQGFKKSEQAYLGTEVTFDQSDFDPNGHANEIFISEYYANEASAAASAERAKKVKDILLAIVVLLAVGAIIAHMVYVKFFSAKYPEDYNTVANAPEANNAYVLSVLNKLVDEEFSPLCDPNETPGPDIVRYPAGKKAAYHAKEVLDDILANHLPVSGEAAQKLKEVSIVTNDAFSRAFAGSKAYIIITILIAVGACFLGEVIVGPLVFFGLSCIMYWLSCYTPNYILVNKDLKALKAGRNRSQSFMTATLAGILGFAASAPVFVEVTKNRHTGEVIKTEEDHSPTIIFLILGIILLFVVAYFMFAVAFFNYLRNYLLRK